MNKTVRLTGALRAWDDARRKRKKSNNFQITKYQVSNIEFDSTEPCWVIGGPNGGGKSRFLRELQETTALDESVYIDINNFCFGLISILKSRDDFEGMISETEQVVATPSQLAELNQIIGKDYSEVHWYTLDIMPDDPRIDWDVARLLGLEGVPYFVVRAEGFEYGSLEMGLGELSVHLLIWLLNQLRDPKLSTLILDEPDAFLHDRSTLDLVLKLITYGDRNSWTIVMSTHSAFVGFEAAQRNSFMYLYEPGEEKFGHLKGTEAADAHSLSLPVDIYRKNPPLSTPNTVDYIFVVEDESAKYLAEALVERFLPSISDKSRYIWVGGHGNITAIRNLGKDIINRITEAKVIFLYDGDQRKMDFTGEANFGYLPTKEDPDDLFSDAIKDSESIALKLDIAVERIEAFRRSYQGQDVHDFVNQLGVLYGREKVLKALAWHVSCSNKSDSYGQELMSIFIEQ